MNPKLEQLLDMVKEHKMTSQEMAEQAISFAYGNIALHNPKTTKEMVREEAAKIERYDPKGKAYKE